MDCLNKCETTSLVKDFRYCVLPAHKLDEDLLNSADFLHVGRQTEDAGIRLVGVAILDDDPARS